MTVLAGTALLSEQFLSKYKGVRPKNAGKLFDLISLRYRRWIPELKRRESWLECCQRTVEYNINLGLSSQEDAELMFDSMFHLLTLPAGRAMAIGGSEASRIWPEANFNCAGTSIESIEDFCDVFHLSLCSAGIGWVITEECISKLPGFNTDFSVFHDPYVPVYPKILQPCTTLQQVDNELRINIGDSKEGWVASLRNFLLYLSEVEDIRSIYINYDFVRPEGERLKTWGGRAAGPHGLKEMFSKLETIIKRSGGKLRPIDALDINTCIGNNVVSGGSRRAAMIGLFSPEDHECLEAKSGKKLGSYIEVETGREVDWSEYFDGEVYLKEKFDSDKYEGRIDWKADPETGHRTMSNNSIVFSKKPKKEELATVFEKIKTNGEPGFFNLEAALLKRPRAFVLNPCAEILLANKGVCNLSTTPLTSHLIFDGGKYTVNYESLEISQRLATRIGLRQTNVTLSLPEWDKIQKEDRLLGVSLTGQMDALDMLGWENCGTEHRSLLKWLGEIANNEADIYSQKLGIPRPLLVTAVKPEGSLSLLPTVSCGIHRSFSPYYIRRIKYARFDPVAKALMKLGVPYETDKTKKNSNRIVFLFPVKSPASVKASDESFREQFNRYLLHQEVYTDHNTSVTLYVGEDEWQEALDMVYESWDKVIAVSFLSKREGVYTQAPYESCSKDEHMKLMSIFPNLDNLDETVDQFERQSEHEEFEILDVSCMSGICPTV